MCIYSLCYEFLTLLNVNLLNSLALILNVNYTIAITKELLTLTVNGSVIHKVFMV